MRVQPEDEENSLFDEARVDTEQDVQKQFEEGVMSRGIKKKGSSASFYQTSRKNFKHVWGNWGRLEA